MGSSHSSEYPVDNSQAAEANAANIQPQDYMLLSPISHHFWTKFQFSAILHSLRFSGLDTLNATDLIGVDVV
ncbi:hypothetical protein ACS0TY_025653 [Phlomoides rotata]